MLILEAFDKYIHRAILAGIFNITVDMGVNSYVWVDWIYVNASESYCKHDTTNKSGSKRL